MGILELTQKDLITTSLKKATRDLSLDDFRISATKCELATRIIYISPSGERKVLKERAPRKVLTIGQGRPNKTDRFR